MKFDLNNPRTLSMTAIMTALTLALTRSAVPNGVGYNHLGDIAVFFTAFAFGPWAGLVAGGLGTALADILSGAYAGYAPLSFMVHGLEGFVAGYIYLQRRDIIGLVLGLVAGGVIVVGGYFGGEYLNEGWGGPVQALGEWPGNIIQVAIGVVGAVVFYAVQRAYPRLRQMGA